MPMSLQTCSVSSPQKPQEQGRFFFEVQGVNLSKLLKSRSPLFQLWREIHTGAVNTPVAEGSARLSGLGRDSMLTMGEALPGPARWLFTDDVMTSCGLTHISFCASFGIWGQYLR